MVRCNIFVLKEILVYVEGIGEENVTYIMSFFWKFELIDVYRVIIIDF